MSSTWEYKPLGRICDVIAGQSPEGKYYNKEGKGLPFYQGKKEFSDKYIGEPTTWTTKVTKEAVAGDILMSVRAPVGPINFANEKICIGRGLAAIRAKDGLDRDFLYYGLLSMQPEISGKDGAVFASINRSEISAIDFPIPPLKVQQRIVAILDEAFAGIATATANAEKNLKNAHELFESTLQSVFAEKGEGWVEKPLSEICNIKHGFAFKGKDFSPDTDESKPIVITPGNFTEDGQLSFTEKNTKRLSVEPPKEFVFHECDLVIVMTDLSSKMKILGKPACIECSNILHNQRIGKIEFFDDSVDAKLLYYFFMTQDFLRNIKETATGSMVKHTAPKRILSNVIPYPENRDKQRRVVGKLNALAEKVRVLEEIYEKKLVEIIELKQSILQKAFAGELH